jgi:hypothetical protein
MRGMTMFQQTVTIPPDRRLYLELPKTAPSGRVEIAIVFNSIQPREAQRPELPAEFRESMRTLEDCKREAAEKRALREAEGRGIFDGAAACLKDAPPFFGGIDGVAYQRNLRDEWPD